MVRVFLMGSSSSTNRIALRSANAPVGQVCTHCPQNVQAEPFSKPLNSVVICV